MPEKKPEIARSPEVLREFEAYDQQARIENTKLACWLVFTLTPAGFTLDYFVYPGRLWDFLQVRLLCSLFVALIWLLTRSPFGARHHRAFGVLLPLLPSLMISWMIYSTEGVSSTYYAGLNLVIFGFGMVMPWTYLENLWEGILIIAMYVGACLVHPKHLQDLGIFVNNLYFMVLTEIVVMAYSYNQRQLRFREFALRFELDKSGRLLKETNQKLVEMDQVKNRFFANISHELRTPLTLLIAPLEELQRQPSLAREAGETLRMMQNNAMRLLKLINDLLDLVKLESGGMKIQKEPVGVEEFIKGLAQSVQGTAKDRGVRLSWGVGPGIGALRLDRDKLEKIVLNLVFNAVKFTPAGGEVELSADARDSFLTLKVRDTGIGISEGDLPFVFDRFWQADASSQRRYQGTGIGLALVKELAEAQGGTVDVESRVGKGSTFTVRLPAEKAGAPEPAGKEDVDPGFRSAPGLEEWRSKLYRRAEFLPSLYPVAAGRCRLR